MIFTYTYGVVFILVPIETKVGHVIRSSLNCGYLLNFKENYTISPHMTSCCHIC